MSAKNGWNIDIKERARSGVLRHAAKNASVSEIIAALKRESVDEDSVRAAIWFLIGRGQIELTPDREIALVRRVPNE
jgi:hypothetical protein